MTIVKAPTLIQRPESTALHGRRNEATAPIRMMQKTQKPVGLRTYPPPRLSGAVALAYTGL